MSNLDFSLPPLLSPLLWLPAITVRDELICRIKNNDLSQLVVGLESTPTVPYPRSLFRQPLAYEYLYQYFLIQIQAAYLAQREIIEGKSLSKTARQSACRTFLEIIKRDLSRVSLPAAVTAWLTTDDWRWHREVKEAPEDLYYGLILEFPNAVLRYAQFLLFWEQRPLLLKLLKPLCVEQSYRIAEKSVKAVFQKQSRGHSDLEIYDF